MISAFGVDHGAISKGIPSFLKHGSPEAVDRILQKSPSTAARYSAWEKGQRATGFLGQRKGAKLLRSEGTADFATSMGMNSITSGKEARTLSRALPARTDVTSPVPANNVANRRAVAAGDARFRRKSRRAPAI